MNEMLDRVFDRKYKITRMLGEGGMGTVYEAEHQLIHRTVAVKVMHNEFASTPEVVSRFFREARAASAIGHPNIVEIHDVGKEEDGTVFIVMELLRGQSLKELLDEQTKIEPTRAVSIALQVLSALVAAHEKQIIHRDMKPDNIFIATGAEGRQEVRLLDFGIAKVLGALEGDQGLTKTGTVLGTPSYMSPEQARGKDIDHRIDIWAVGVMLYEMLSGRLPYSGNSYNEIIGEILLEEAPPLAQVAPELSPELVSAVERAMRKSRDERYKDAGEMIRALLPFAGSTEGLMSDPVIKALRSSIAPPPPADDQNGGVTASDRGEVSKKEPLDLSRDIMRKPRRSIGPALKILLLALFLVALGAGYIAYTEGVEALEERSRKLVTKAVSTGEETLELLEEQLAPATVPNDTPLLTPAVLLSSAPDAGTPIDASLPPLDAGAADAGRETAPPEPEPVQAAEPSLPEKVTIELTGLPRRTKIKVNGKKSKPKFTAPGSEEELTIKITARGYRPHEQKIIPSADQTVEIEMKKKSKRRKSRRKRRSR